MSKRINNLKWETVAMEGFPASLTENFDGFVGLEECTNYDLDREKKPRKVSNNLSNSTLMFTLCLLDNKSLQTNTYPNII